jgi:methylglyoxal reductase
MKYRRIGKTDLFASCIGLGTFEIGGSSWWDDLDDKKSIRTIQAALDIGVNFIDTAPVYGYGHSERLVGRVIKGCRDKVILATKVGEEYTGYNEGRFHYNHDGKNVYTCLTKKAIFRQIEDSLRNLDTDYIDMYSPHYYFDDNSIGRIDEAMDAFLTLKKQGKIRYVFVSNMTYDHLKNFNENNELGVCGMQLFCNVLDHDILSSSIGKYIVANGLSAFGINSMAKGLLAGAFPDDYKVKAGSERSESPWFLDGRIAKVNEMLRSWTPLCEKYSASTSAIAIAWTLAQPGFTHIMAGAVEPEHAKANADASDIELEPEEITFLTNAAKKLKAETIDCEREKARRIFEKLAKDRTPVIFWGAGVTADYISKRLPLDQCNVIAVVDSNPDLREQTRFNCSVMPLNHILTLHDDAKIVVLIPSEEIKLNTILNNLGNKKEIIHMGKLKATCK